jgi:hypothetical protein
MIAQLRVVLPGVGYLVASIVGFALLELFYGYLEWRFGPQDPNSSLRVSLLWWPFFLATYAAWRVSGYHPVARRTYADWLGTAPWTNQRRLPLGPVHWAWQDLVLVGLAALFNAYFSWRHSLWAVCVFVGMYLLQLTFTFARSGQFWSMCFSVFGVGLMVVLRRDPVVCLGAGLASYIVLFRHILAAVPWVQLNPSGEPPSGGSNLNTILSDGAERFGLPFARSGPRLWESITLPRGGGLALGVLYGWLTYILTTFSDRGDVSGVLVFAAMGTVVMAFARVALYLTGYAPPISFWARLVTLRWIIPRYDYALLAPLIAISFLMAMGRLIARQQWDPNIYGSIALGGTVTLLLVLGPSLKKWRLTGNHRITLSANGKLKLVRSG